jgi:predicted acetyltransferase
MSIRVATVIGEDGLREAARVHMTAFGHPVDEEKLQKLILPALSHLNVFGAFEDGRMVGVAVDLPLELTVPGGRFVKTRGLTWVGTLPTHRRRGALSALMRHHLDGLRELGMPLSILYASETTIYGRFGFGPATQRISEADIDSRHGTFAVPFEDDGRMVLIDDPSPVGIMREVLDGARPQIPGEVDRSDSDLADDFAWDADKKEFRVAHAAPGGTYDAFAVYKIESDWPHEAYSQSRVVVSTLLASSDRGYAAMWRYLLDLDLTQAVTVRNRPLDDPIRWLLAEWRRFHVRHVSEGLWVALLDVPASLEARSYAADGELVLDVGGERYMLTVSAGNATCQATGRDADIALGLAELGAAYLGGQRFDAMRRAFRVRELSPGACVRADGMFRSPREPWCSYEF